MNTERETLHISDDKQRIATIDGNLVRYQLSDHLGSASVELDENADIISYEEYYPFGSTSYRDGRNEVDVSLKRYKYVMKELDNETGLYYYGMRYYTSWICRFISVDPLQHKYPIYTPYQYAGNKPISFIDLDGAEPLAPEGAKSNAGGQSGKETDLVPGYPKLSALLQDMPEIYKNQSPEFKKKFENYSELKGGEINFVLNPNNLGEIKLDTNEIIAAPKVTTNTPNNPSENISLIGLIIDNYWASQWESTSPPNLDQIPLKVTKKYAMNVRTHLEEEAYKEMFTRQLFAAYIAYGDAFREIVDANPGVSYQNIDITLNQGEFDNVVTAMKFGKPYFDLDQDWSSIFEFIKDTYGYSIYNTKSEYDYYLKKKKELSNNQDIRNKDIALRDRLLQNAKKQKVKELIIFGKFDYLN